MSEANAGHIATATPSPYRRFDTFMRVILALGVRDRERSKFWRYMACVAASHREAFARAVILAAMGYHFRKLTELLPLVTNSVR